MRPLAHRLARALIAASTERGKRSYAVVDNFKPEQSRDSAIHATTQRWRTGTAHMACWGKHTHSGVRLVRSHRKRSSFASASGRHHGSGVVLVKPSVTHSQIAE